MSGTRVRCVTCGGNAVIIPPLREGEKLRHEHSFSAFSNRYEDLGWYITERQP